MLNITFRIRTTKCTFDRHLVFRVIRTQFTLQQVLLELSSHFGKHVGQRVGRRVGRRVCGIGFLTFTLKSNVQIATPFREVWIIHKSLTPNRFQLHDDVPPLTSPWRAASDYRAKWRGQKNATARATTQRKRHLGPVSGKFRKLFGPRKSNS